MRRRRREALPLLILLRLRLLLRRLSFPLLSSGEAFEAGIIPRPPWAHCASASACSSASLLCRSWQAGRCSVSRTKPQTFLIEGTKPRLLPCSRLLCSLYLLLQHSAVHLLQVLKAPGNHGLSQAAAVFASEASTSCSFGECRRPLRSSSSSSALSSRSWNHPDLSPCGNEARPRALPLSSSRRLHLCQHGPQTVKQNPADQT